MSVDFADKRVLVTGGSRGIGRAVVEAFLKAGARVALNGSTAQTVDSAIAELGGGDRLAAAPGNIGAVAGCQAAVRAAIEGLGGLDVLVNSAGVGDEASIEETNEALWDKTLDVNLKGTFFSCQAALAALRAVKGNIVNVASVTGLMPDVNLSAYCASKGGLVNLTRAMALELAPNVRVNCVCPGFVDTDMIRRDLIDKSDDPAATEQVLVDYAPLKRTATPEEIAYSVLYLASHDAGFITGSALQIDGGASAGHSSAGH